MSIRLPVLDERDFVFPGPSGLCSYRAAYGDQTAELALPGPNGSNLRLVSSGDELQLIVNGTFIASISDFNSLDEPLRTFLIDNYFSTLRAAAAHRVPAMQDALRSVGSGDSARNKPA